MRPQSRDQLANPFSRFCSFSANSFSRCVFPSFFSLLILFSLFFFFFFGRRSDHFETVARSTICWPFYDPRKFEYRCNIEPRCFALLSFRGVEHVFEFIAQAYNAGKIYVRLLISNATGFLLGTLESFEFLTMLKIDRIFNKTKKLQNF